MFWYALNLIVNGLASAVLIVSVFGLWRPSAEVEELSSFIALVLGILSIFGVYQLIMEFFIIRFSGARNESYYIMGGRNINEYPRLLVLLSLPTFLLVLLLIPVVRESLIATAILSGLFLLPAFLSFSVESNIAENWVDSEYDKTVEELYQEWSLEKVEAKLSELIMMVNLEEGRELQVRVDGESSGIPSAFADAVYATATAAQIEFLHEYFVACMHAVKREQGRDISHVTFSVVSGAVDFTYK